MLAIAVHGKKRVKFERFAGIVECTDQCPAVSFVLFMAYGSYPIKLIEFLGCSIG
jgi:hypothetical protein